MSELETKETLL